MKNLSRIEIYDAPIQEAESKQTTLSLIVNLRTEDTYRLLIANLLKLRPNLVISINKKDCKVVADLRGDSEIV